MAMAVAVVVPLVLGSLVTLVVLSLARLDSAHHASHITDRAVEGAQQTQASPSHKGAAPSDARAAVELGERRGGHGAAEKRRRALGVAAFCGAGRANRAEFQTHTATMRLDFSLWDTRDGSLSAFGEWLR